MKKILVGLLLIIMCLSISSAFAAPLSISGGTITANTTFNVPSDFTDINAALNYLNDKRIANNVVVTIQVADGTYNYSSSIIVNHPDGDKIQIIGDVTNPTNCILNFATSTCGILVTHVHVLSLINGFKINGYSNTSGTGIGVSDNSYIQCGGSIIVNNFQYGFEAYNNSSADLCAGFTATNNYEGIGAFRCSTITCCNTIATGNTYGYIAYYESLLYTHGSTSTSNTYNYSPANEQVGNFNSVILTTST